MAIENDPDVIPEARSERTDTVDTTVTDPQVTEDQGESSDTSEEGPSAGSDSDSSAADTTKTETPKAAEHDIVVAGEQPAAKKETPDKTKERNKEFARLRARTAELERELAARNPAQQAPDPGKKPTLEDCGYDTPDYETKLDAWYEAKRLKATADAQAAQEAQKVQGERQQKQIKYNQAREDMIVKLPDYVELETLVAAGLSQVQKDVILHYTENPHLVVAALGRNPDRLQDFADTKDLGALIAKAAKLEARTELKSKTTTPPPEKRPTGSGSKTGAVDKKLERLQAIADKTGDRTAVIRHIQEKKRQQRQG